MMEHLVSWEALQAFLEDKGLEQLQDKEPIRGSVDGSREKADHFNTPRRNQRPVWSTRRELHYKVQ